MITLPASPDPVRGDTMTVLRSILLLVGAALAEIGSGWLVWQGAGILALGLYGFVATFQPWSPGVAVSRVPAHNG